jgi:hypothetical protein
MRERKINERKVERKIKIIEIRGRFKICLDLKGVEVYGCFL